VATTPELPPRPLSRRLLDATISIAIMAVPVGIGHVLWGSANTIAIFSVIGMWMALEWVSKFVQIFRANYRAAKEGDAEG
jgi:hypothetical protein